MIDDRVSIILATHNYPEKARLLLDEILQLRNVEVIVVTHDKEHKPEGNDFNHYINPELGAVKSLYYGILKSTSKWFAYIWDDQTLPDPLWLDKARKFIDNYKVISFNVNTVPVDHGRTCAVNALVEKEWYIRHWPKMPYTHYCPDNELADWARREKVYYYAKDIIIQDPKEEQINDKKLAKKQQGRNLYMKRKSLSIIKDGKIQIGEKEECLMFQEKVIKDLEEKQKSIQRQIENAKTKVNILRKL